jgi:hypothetical protein
MDGKVSKCRKFKSTARASGFVQCPPLNSFIIFGFRWLSAGGIYPKLPPRDFSTVLGARAKASGWVTSITDRPDPRAPITARPA